MFDSVEEGLKIIAEGPENLLSSLDRYSRIRLMVPRRHWPKIEPISGLNHVPAYFTKRVLRWDWPKPEPITELNHYTVIH